jgi:predicted nucleic acid-binding protein
MRRWSTVVNGPGVPRLDDHGLVPGTRVVFDVVGDSVRIREAAARFARIEDLEAALPSDCFQRLPLPWEAAFLARRSFAAHRRRGGQRRSPLPDFYIGAHALVSGMTLLTRDPARYRTYFPRLRLVAP